MKPVQLITPALCLLIAACEAPAPPATVALPPTERPAAAATATTVPTPATTDTPEPTAPLEPTASAEPAASTAPATTPLPEGILFRDDFNGTLQAGWTWQNEKPDRWRFVDFGGDQWLEIVGENARMWEGQSNVLARAVPEGDFMLTARVLADPRLNFHQANIFIFQDSANFVVMNTGFCGICGLPEGYGFFMETIIENNPFGDAYSAPRGAEDRDVVLRLVNQAGSITGYYATATGEWQQIGAFGNYFDFVSVGLGATNYLPSDQVVEDIVARFDYFEIALP